MIFSFQIHEIFYVSIISLILIARKMNCSTISMARTATNNAVNSNCCAAAAAALNGNFLNGIANHQTTSMLNGNINSIPIMNANNLRTTTNNNVNGNTNVIREISTTTSQNKKPELAAKIIKNSNIVCFDVDSTVIQEEGIDELADYCGKGMEVSRVTKEAMGGNMTFQDALKIRLNIIRPSQQQIMDFIKTRPSKLTRNIKELVKQLKAEDKEVYLVSGGFDCLIEPVANELNIPMKNVYANKLIFNSNGDYESFDTTQPTSRTGGKAEAITIIKQQYKLEKNNEIDNCEIFITMIGDGATDLEAVPPANHFIGFGGNVVRPEVFKRAQYYVMDFEQLIH